MRDLPTGGELSRGRNELAPSVQAKGACVLLMGPSWYSRRAGSAPFQVESVRTGSATSRASGNVVPYSASEQLATCWRRGERADEEASPRPMKVPRGKRRASHAVLALG